VLSLARDRGLLRDADAGGLRPDRRRLRHRHGRDRVRDQRRLRARRPHGLDHEAQPHSVCGRWVDVFDNVSTTAQPLVVSYTSEYGSDGAGIIYFTPGTGEAG